MLKLIVSITIYSHSTPSVPPYTLHSCTFVSLVSIVSLVPSVSFGLSVQVCICMSLVSTVSVVSLVANSSYNFVFPCIFSGLPSLQSLHCYLPSRSVHPYTLHSCVSTDLHSLPSHFSLSLSLFIQFCIYMSPWSQ